MRDIKRIILGNRITSKIFSSGKEAYIVGGYLRDALAGRESKDIDCIVRGNIREFAAQMLVQERGSATIVELKKERMIRLVFKSGLTLDFTELKGNVNDNLGERDFTMNALAWSPQTGIIDPFNGIKDIAKHRIKAISIDNFRNDPLRLLRTYRFVSEFGWKAEPETRKMVRVLGEEIRNSAPERITLEFFKLLDFKNFHDALKAASDDGLLECFLSITHKSLSENIRSISRLESEIKKLPSKFRRNLEKPLSQELTLHGLLRLERVLYSSALKKNRLRLSRVIRERLKIIHKLLHKSERQDMLSDNNLFETFFRAKDAAIDLLILSGNIKLLGQLERFKKIWEKSFLTSEEIMDITGLKGGVKLGSLIYELKKMQFEGRLKAKKEAEKLLKSIYR